MRRAYRGSTARALLVAPSSACPGKIRMHSTSVRHQAGAPDTARRHTLHRIAVGAATLATPVFAHAQARSTSAQGDILVGRSSALSGPMAPFLAPIHAGQEAAIADFNAGG